MDRASIFSASLRRRLRAVASWSSSQDHFRTQLPDPKHR